LLELVWVVESKNLKGWELGFRLQTQMALVEARRVLLHL
jgi:hypothetical protein